MKMVGDIAGGPFPFHIRPARRVDEHSVVDSHTAGLRQLDVRLDAHRDHRKVARQIAAGRRHGALNVMGALETNYLVTRAELHARATLNSCHPSTHPAAPDRI